MEKLEALHQFKLTPEAQEEDIQQALEERLFEIKKDVLQKYMVPTLLHKKLVQIQDSMLAAYVLGATEESTMPDIPQWQGNPTERVQFIESYEAQISMLKLALMNVQSFHHLMKVIHEFIVTQEYYMVIFRMLFNEFSEALPEEVNTREIIDTGKLLLGMKKGELDNKLTWEIERELARIQKIQSLKSAQ
jgi:hypothetical protein